MLKIVMGPAASLKVIARDSNDVYVLSVDRCVFR
jgi:hypothetical protein